VNDPKTSPAAMDSELFRKMMGCFATGVTIVTTKTGGELHGMTVNSFTSVSLQPMLILICLANEARTTAAVRQRGWFVVNILEERQVALSNRFARPNEDRFAGIAYSLNEYDLPVLPDCLGHMVCRVHRIDPGGDHQIILGEVLTGEFRDARPLLFFRGAYAAAAPNPHAAE
jgi:flavin reductase (DIM6/NTAB) family NADH-FMN oxidoreductase RutF